MNDWQQSFLQKLETAKRQWQSRFEKFAEECVEPVFHQIEEFTLAHGFTVTTPQCDEAVRLFKFALTENGYLIATFRQHGLEEVEADFEVVVPGGDGPTRHSVQARICDTGQRWVEQQFQEALDRFMTGFVEAGEGRAEPASRRRQPARA